MKTYVFMFLVFLSGLSWVVSAQEMDQENELTNNKNIDWEKLDIQFEVKEIHVSEETFLVNGTDTRPALAVNIPESALEDVRKAWSKAIKNKTKSKVLEGGATISILATLLETIFMNPINVYSTLVSGHDEVKIIAAFEAGGEWVSSEGTPDKYKGARKFLMDFAKERYANTVKKQLAEVKKVMRQREGQLQKMRNANKQMHTRISQNEVNIEHTEQDILTNQIDQTAKNKEIIVKKESMAEMQGEIREQAEKELSVLEREKKRLRQQRKSMGSKIVKYKANIEKAKHNIQLNLSEQERQIERVEEQLSKVKSIEEKLAHIK